MMGELGSVLIRSVILRCGSLCSGSSTTSLIIAEELQERADHPDDFGMPVIAPIPDGWVIDWRDVARSSRCRRVSCRGEMARRV